MGYEDRAGSYSYDLFERSTGRNLNRVDPDILHVCQRTGRAATAGGRNRIILLLAATAMAALLVLGALLASRAVGARRGGRRTVDRPPRGP